jgi:hypothetical protein
MSYLTFVEQAARVAGGQGHSPGSDTPGASLRMISTKPWHEFGRCGIGHGQNKGGLGLVRPQSRRVRMTDSSCRKRITNGRATSASARGVGSTP